MRRQCEAEGCERPAQPRKKLCGYHLGNHDPVPDHHVAADRTCFRCRETFASTWAGDRTCPTCREQLHRAEKEAVKRSQTPAHYVSPYEPDGIPGLAR